MGGFAVTSKAWSAAVEFPPHHCKNPTAGLRLYCPAFVLVCCRSLHCPYHHWNTSVLLTCCVMSGQGSLHQTLLLIWSIYKCFGSKQFMQSLLLIDTLLLSQCWFQPGRGVVVFWYKGWCSSLLLPCPGIYCFWVCARYGTAAHNRALPSDLGILIPKVLADTPDSSSMGDAASTPCVLALGRWMCPLLSRVTEGCWWPGVTPAALTVCYVLSGAI